MPAKDLRELPGYRADAPGARLDGQEWAASWPAFLRAVFGEDDRLGARQFIANAWKEGVPDEGGFLVPEGLRAEVMSYITPAVVRPRAMVLPMGQYRLGVPYVDDPSQASGKQALGGLTFSFVKDTHAIPATAPGFGRALLEASKLAALVGIPAELESDAAGALGDFISRVIAIGYAWTEDESFVNGTGAAVPQGVLNASCAVNVTRANSAAAPVLADVIGVAKALHPASKAAGYTAGITDVGWLASTTVLDALLELYFNPSGGSAAGIVSPSPWLDLGDGHDVAPSILGLPAFISDHSPAAGNPGDLALIDFRNYLIGDRLELTIERSAAGSGFITDIVNYRIRARVDGRYFVPSPATTEAGQVVSPVVVLE